VANLNKSLKAIRHNYRPEQKICPVCGRFLKRSHIQWRKPLLFSTGREEITSWAYRCEDMDCPGYQRIWVSQVAESLHLWYRRYSRDLVVKVGYRRFWLHQTLEELHEWLTQDLNLPISEREILNVIGDFLALLRAGQSDKIRQRLEGLKELVIGLDGMQPEKGNTCLYIVREMQSGLTLLAENLDDSAHPVLRVRLFEPLKILAQELDLGWKGVISDAQESIRLAVSNSLPGVPHQVCQFHCLRDAGSLIFERDRSLKTHLKSMLRKFLGRLERAIQRLPATDLQKAILADYALAIHTTLLMGGVAPFNLAGLQIMGSLNAISASLQRCQQKGTRPMLVRLLKVTDQRLPFQTQAEELQRQRQWLIDLDRLMELDQQPPPTASSVSQAVDQYLQQLITHTQQSGTIEDQQAASQINQIVRNLWWGLFTCYAVDGLPRTNNALEQFIRRIKMGQRKISGRKNVQDFVLRYGSFAAFIDYAESEQELCLRLARVAQTDFRKERNALNMIVVKEQKIYRFRFHPQTFLIELESRWEESLRKTS